MQKGGRSVKKKETVKETSMLELIKTYLAESDNIVVSCECDLSQSGYTRVLVCALEDSLCVLGDDGSFMREKYSAIEDIYAENYVSSGGLIIRINGADIPIAQFTFKLSAKIEQRTVRL